MEYKPQNALGYQISLTALMVRHEFGRRIGHLNLASEQFGILCLIDEHPELTQTEIAQMLCKNKTTVTRMMDALVKKGLITKEWNRDDRRTQRIEMTPQGREALDKALPIAAQMGEDLKKLVKEEHAEIVLEAMDKIQFYCQKRSYKTITRLS
jgi:MarR family transcriptional regulator for hemolysin